MKFEIERSSLRGAKVEEHPPCEGAVLETIDIHTLWTIEINSLEELLALSAKVECDIIVHRVDIFPKLPPGLVIHDDFSC